MGALMRGSELVVRGGLVVDMADSHPFEFPQGSSKAKVEDGSVIFYQVVRKVHLFCFYWSDELDIY